MRGGAASAKLAPIVKVFLPGKSSPAGNGVSALLSSRAGDYAVYLAPIVARVGVRRLRRSLGLIPVVTPASPAAVLRRALRNEIRRAIEERDQELERARAARRARRSLVLAVLVVAASGAPLARRFRPGADPAPEPVEQPVAPAPADPVAPADPAAPADTAPPAES